MATGLRIALALTLTVVATSAAASPINTFGIWTGTDSCAPCSGLGTNTLEDGIPIANSVTNLFRFDGLSTDVNLGEIFVLGTLSFRNGRVGSGGLPAPTYFDLRVSTTSPDLAFNQSIDLRVNFSGTPNTSDPYASADYIWITSPAGERQFSQALRVFEDSPGVPSVGTIELLGRIDSLHYEGFGALLTPNTAFVTATSAPNDFTPVPVGVPDSGSPAALLVIGIAVLFATERLRGVGRL